MLQSSLLPCDTISKYFFFPFLSFFPSPLKDTPKFSFWYPEYTKCGVSGNSFRWAFSKRWNTVGKKIVVMSRGFIMRTKKTNLLNKQNPYNSYRVFINSLFFFFFYVVFNEFPLLPFTFSIVFFFHIDLVKVKGITSLEHQQLFIIFLIYLLLTSLLMTNHFYIYSLLFD